LLLSVCLAAAQDKPAAKKPAPAPPPMDEKAMMELMQKVATPGEAHKKLNFLVGSWRTRNNMWMDPSKPPIVSEGTAEMKWVLGGRFVEQRYEGTFMNQPFSGLGYSGYDNIKRKYISSWMDTLGTTILFTTGSFDPTGKKLSSSGRMDDPTTGKSTRFRDRMTIVSNDELLVEMWAAGPDGKEFRMMELRYMRKK
jgi:hypothetical protein